MNDPSTQTGARDTHQPRRPLERRRDWIGAVLGVVVFGVIGYVAEGVVISSPLVIALAVFLVAVFVRFYQKSKGSSS